MQKREMFGLGALQISNERMATPGREKFNVGKKTYKEV
jgi:hypothetical protein